MMFHPPKLTDRILVCVSDKKWIAAQPNRLYADVSKRGEGGTTIEKIAEESDNPLDGL